MRIPEENARSGTRDWWSLTHAADGAIEGYSTQPSARPGGRVELCVSTRPVARYDVVLHRLGWYGGDGAREVARGPSNIGLARSSAEADPATGLVAARWPVTDSLEIPPDATSGHWVVHLRLTSGPHAGTSALVPFVVRPRPDDRPTVLVQTPAITAQAHNRWGLVDEQRAVKMSFDRPLAAGPGTGPEAAAPVLLARWMERRGYDVGYQTGVDTHRAPWSLVGPRLIVCSGHDGHWTAEIRDAFEDARDRGTNLAFLGAHIGHWQVRLQDGERTLVSYESVADDPETVGTAMTCRFRDLDPPREEHALLGLRSQTDATVAGDYAVDPAALEDPWMRATGFDADRSPVAGAVAGRSDALRPGHDPPGLVRFLHHGSADCIRWAAPSGARVVAAGTLGLVRVLGDVSPGADADARVQRLLGNAFDDLTA